MEGTDFKFTNGVSQLRIRGINVYIDANRKREDYEAILSIIKRIPKECLVYYDKNNVPSGVIKL